MSVEGLYVLACQSQSKESVSCGGKGRECALGFHKLNFFVSVLLDGDGQRYQYCTLKMDLWSCLVFDMWLLPVLLLPWEEDI